MRGGTLSHRSWLYRFLARWYGDAKARSFRDTCQLRGALFQPTLVILLVSGFVAFVISGLVKLFAVSVELNGASQSFLNLGSTILIMAGFASIIMGATLALAWLQERVPKIGKPLAIVAFGAIILVILAGVFLAVIALGEVAVRIASSMAPELEQLYPFLSDHPIWAGAVGLAVIFLVFFTFFSAYLIAYLILKGVGGIWNVFWSLEDQIAVIAWIKGRLCKRLTYER